MLHDSRNDRMCSALHGPRLRYVTSAVVFRICSHESLVLMMAAIKRLVVPPMGDDGSMPRTAVFQFAV